MADATSGLWVLYEAGPIGAYSRSDGGAWFEVSCPHCGAPQLLTIGRQLNETNSAPVADRIKWLKCPACGKGCVYYDETTWPNERPLRTPSGLPPIDKAIWEEVRDCLSVGAYVAAVMLCRKLLFHIAVAHGLPAQNGKGRAPTFAAAVTHLQGEGVISAKMRPWVDRIKDIGNDANHEVTPVDRDSALKVATFTEQLLRLAYEFDAEMAEVDPAGAEAVEAVADE